jgi:hypothetical protein
MVRETHPTLLKILVFEGTVMSKRKHRGTCIYCGDNPAIEDEHVLAKQFFPAEERYRGQLIKVPACGICNREKQKVEDSAGFFLQLSHASPASEAVLEKRAKRTLRKNLRLARAFRQGFGWSWVTLDNGLVVKRLGIQLEQKELDYINEWYKFLTKGFYYYEFNEILPKDHSIYLIKPLDLIQFLCYRDLIIKTNKHRSRSLADGEFRYIVASNDKEGLSFWLFLFRSVEIFAVTVGPECPPDFHAVLHRNAWKESSPKRSSS